MISTNIYLRLKGYLRLRSAIKTADKQHSLTGQRFYVIPVAGKRKALIVTDRKNFRLLKLKHYIPSGASISYLEATCFYATPYKDGSRQFSKERILAGRERFMRWFMRR